MTEIDFKFGTLIRTGPALIYGGKWDADLVDWKIDATTNAFLTIFIRVHFDKIDPAGATGTYGDYDDKPGHPSQKPIQKWKPGEFERFVRNLTTSAQSYWDGQFWLKTPNNYDGLNYFRPGHPTYRCNIYCKLNLKASSAADAHYTIAVVRAQDGVFFRSDSVLYSQNEIQADHMIPRSTVKFWAHFHEVGHLLGLGHVGTGGHVNDGGIAGAAYGVTAQEMQDVMGRGHSRHDWHATPWREAAESFSGVKASDWKVFQRHIAPVRV